MTDEIIYFNALSDMTHHYFEYKIVKTTVLYRQKHNLRWVVSEYFVDPKQGDADSIRVTSLYGNNLNLLPLKKRYIFPDMAIA